MKQLLDGSRFGYRNNQLYVQGNYMEWYNEDEDCLEGPECPLGFRNLMIMYIDEDGIYLELNKNDLLEEDDTWHIYEQNCNGKYNIVDCKVLKDELRA